MQPENNPSNQQPSTNVVHVARPISPEKPVITPEVQKKHEDSKSKFPQLNLSEGEYVISEVKRHPIGLVQIWAFSAFIFALLVAVIAFLMSDRPAVAGIAGGTGSPLTLLTIPLLMLAALVVVGCAIATFVYNANAFYLTNESVIQKIQTGLFNKRMQTVSLGNIEDASFSQDGILPHMFNYGFIRLSTEGDETTYRFNYASEPERQVGRLNNAVEAYKNGRPVEEY